jgi:hypothetical protein
VNSSVAAVSFVTSEAAVGDAVDVSSEANGFPYKIQSKIESERLSAVEIECSMRSFIVR